jgi:hypothetical protein
MCATPRTCGSLRTSKSAATSLGTSRPPVAVDGAIFASYQHLGSLLTSQEFQAFAAANANGPGAFAENGPTRTNRHFLVSVDYSDPRHPLLSSGHPNLPGRLIGVAREGKILSPPASVTIQFREASIPGGRCCTPVPSMVTSCICSTSSRSRQYGKPPEIRGMTIFQFQPQPAKIWVPSKRAASRRRFHHRGF